MTITEQTLTEYRERFKDVIYSWLVDTETKRWYGKYHFRVELLIPRDWDIRNFRNSLKHLDPDCRLRKETYLRFFTNNLTALDAILNDPELLKKVKGFTTSNDQYITAIKNLDNIAVDVKLVSETKYDPLIPYQVDFETYWGWVGGGQGSSKQSQRQNLLELYKFVSDNKDDLSIPYELNRWCFRAEIGLDTNYYYGAVRVYCRSGDNIPLLYMLFQDGIKKVYKLEKKVKA